jgi:hypothetical protein
MRRFMLFLIRLLALLRSKETVRDRHDSMREEQIDKAHSGG